LLTHQDRFDDVGREQGQAQDTRHVGGRNPLVLGQFGDGCELPRVQHPLLAEGPCLRLNRGIVQLALARCTIRQLHLPVAAALHEAELDVHSHGFGECLTLVMPQFRGQPSFRASARSAVQAEANTQPIGADIDSLDQRSNEGHLLGVEEFFPCLRSRAFVFS
jgi:hypothetical protein